MLHSSDNFIKILQKLNSAQRTNGGSRATINRKLRCLAPAFQQKPQNFSGEVVQPLTSGWILLPRWDEVQEGCQFFFTIYLHSAPRATWEWRSGCLRRELTAINPAYET